MKRTANARFAITKWDEKPYSEGPDQPKLTRASVSKTLTGDIEGESHTEYLMVYRADGSATFVASNTLRLEWRGNPAASCCSGWARSRVVRRRNPIR